MGQAVGCTGCGASTPLPDDLRIPAFRCAACGTELATASYAGVSAVSADALLAHMRHAVASAADPRTAAANAPRFEGEGHGGPLAFDMARQIQGNQALARLKAEGARCGSCGGVNPVPEDGSVQLVCKFCGAAVMLAQLVDASALGRARLRHGVMALKDDMIRQQQARDRVVRNVILALVALTIVVAVGSLLVFR